MKIVFTPYAEDTYDSITAQLFERWGENIVEKFEDNVSHNLDLISASPLMYPLYKDSQVVRKCVLHKNTSMLYRVYDEVILIIGFWDNRQDPIFLP